MSKHNINEWWQELDDDHSLVEIHPPRLPRKKAQKSRPGKEAQLNQVLHDLAVQDIHPDNFNFTYQASRHERAWLLDSLGDFYTHHWIEDVLRLVKGGKEASVYLCLSNQAADQELTAAPELKKAPALLAAKIYRPRMLRNLKNDAVYREGRADLDENGNEILKHRELRAIHKRTEFGQALRHISWIEHDEVFDPVPVGSASIACIYQATLKGGEKVGIKVRRPGIEELFMADLRVIDWLCELAEFLTFVRPGFTRNLPIELKDTLSEELDFRREGPFQDTFRRNSKKSGQDFFTAPRVYFDLSGDEVLVQEFVTGLWLW